MKSSAPHGRILEKRFVSQTATIERRSFDS